MDRITQKISLKDFEVLCLIGQRYEGEVEGLGYVYWVPRNIILPGAGLPSLTPDNTLRGSQFAVDLYELSIVKDANSSDKGIEALRRIKNAAIDALSIYGIAKSIEATMSKKLVILGPEYVQVNPQGTIERNPNRKYTNKGAIAKGIAKKVAIAGVIVDWSMVWFGERKWEDAAVNTVVNAGIWLIGIPCPPASIALAIAWYILSHSSGNHVSGYVDYKEIRGSITPTDNTRVVLPDHHSPKIPMKQTIPVHEPRQCSFNQGRRR
jgi:hypothetical protein